MLPKAQIETAGRIMEKFEGHIDSEKIRLWAYSDQGAVGRSNIHTAMMEMVLRGDLTLSFAPDSDDPLMKVTEQGQKAHENESKG